MRIISVKTIKSFWEKPKYSDSEQALRSWFFEVKNGEWKYFDNKGKEITE